MWILLVQDHTLRNNAIEEGKAWILGELSLIQSIFWTLILYIFVLRQIMLSEVKYLIFDMSNLDNYIRFSHFGIKSVF